MQLLYFHTSVVGSRSEARNAINLIKAFEQIGFHSGLYDTGRNQVSETLN